MLKKKYVLISIIIVVLVVFVLSILWYIQYTKNDTIFDMIKSIDYSGTEQQVVDKISRLLQETIENQNSPEKWGKLGMNLFIHDFINESIPCFKMAHNLDQEEFDWIYFYSIGLNEVNSDEVTLMYEKCRDLNPEYPPLLMHLGNRYLMEGKVEKAKEAYTTVINAKIKVPHVHLGLAKIALEEGNMEHAEEELILAIKMAPNYREAHALLGDVYRRKGEQEKAKKEFDLIHKLPERLDLKDPVYYKMVEEGVSSFWYQVRGNNYLNSSALNKAEEEFKKAIEAKPNESSFTSLGYVYQQQKRFEAAMEQYNKALKINPEYTGALNNLAVIYYELDDTEKAVETIDKALKTDPTSVEAYLNLGTFLKRRGNRAKALTTFHKGMELAPDDLRFVYQISWLLATAPETHLRNGAESLRLAELICEQTSRNNPTSLDLLSVALAETHQFEEASKTAQKAYVLAMKSNKSKLAKNIKTRQKLFNLKRPYRETTTSK